MEYQLYKNIVSDADTCNGKPIIKHTRITVQSVMSFILAGDSDEEVLASFPRLKPEDLQACKDFTAMLFEKPTLIKPLKAAS